MLKSTGDGDGFIDASDVGAIVLGGGQGSRLFPLTLERAKPAVPLGGRYRLIDIPLSNCINSGINRVYVMTQYNSTSLNRHVGNAYKFDNFSGGFVEILAATQTSEKGDDWYQGTADAVRKHLKHIFNLGVSYYLILSGDQLYRMDYRSMLRTHIMNDADITVAALPVTRESAKSLGILQVATNGRIKEFVEKPKEDAVLDTLETPRALLDRFGLSSSDGREYLGSMGVYVFQADVLYDILAKKEDWTDFGHHVIPRSLKSRKVHAHLFNGFWEDIGTVRSYYEVSMRLCAPNPPFEFYDPHRELYTRPRYLPGSRLQGAVVKDSIICEGCLVTGATITNCIVGIRSILNRGAQVDRCVIMGADYYEEEGVSSRIPIGIGRASRVSGAIIDKNARIGKNVVIAGSRKLKDYQGEGFVIRDGIVIVLKGAVIPDGTQIGVAGSHS
jgi:glucose-1-phosphate adenylyltransferase